MFFFAEAHHQVGLIDVILDWKTNVINWVLLMAVVVYAINKLVPPILSKRERDINEALTLAERSKQEADELFAQQKAKIEAAKSEASKMVDEAKTVGKQLAAEIAAQTKREVEDLERKMESALATERQVIVNEVRQAAVKAAMQLSRTHLESNVSEADNKRLLTQFMQELDSLSADGESFAPGTALGVSGQSKN